MARVTVSDLRNEARRKLNECSGGKTISRMNRTELIRFLQCIDDRALADTYEQQEANRQYERAQTRSDSPATRARSSMTPWRARCTAMSVRTAAGMAGR